MKYTVTQEMSLLEALALLSPDSSKTTLRSWLKDERIYVNNEMIKLANHPIMPGHSIEILARKQVIEGNIHIIYEDAHLVVVDKPTGILSVAAAFETENTVHAFLKAKYRPRKVYVVHRLDQDTSGVMLFALSEKAYDSLKKTFEEHKLERSYIAIVEGHLPKSAGTWESYLYEDSNYVVRSTEDTEKGRLSITHYSVLGANKNYSWLRLTLETGRKNQIRVHCQDHHCPVAGDKKYGAKTNPVKRVCLHATVLSFQHPITKKKMHFESPAPKAFYKILKPHTLM